MDWILNRKLWHLIGIGIGLALLAGILILIGG